MFNLRNFAFALVALLLLVTAPAQAIATYQGPSGPAYGYALDVSGNCYFTQAQAVGVGQAPNTTIVTLNSTFTLSTPDLGTSLVFAVEGLSAAAVPLPYGQYGLVGSTLQTVAMSLNSGQYEWSLAIGSNPALVGLHLYFQCAHLYTSNPCNDYVVTDGITFTIQ